MAPLTGVLEVVRDVNAAVRGALECKERLERVGLVGTNGLLRERSEARTDLKRGARRAWDVKVLALPLEELYGAIACGSACVDTGYGGVLTASENGQNWSGATRATYERAIRTFTMNLSSGHAQTHG